MARVRHYNTATTRFGDDAATDGYGPIDFGPVHDEDGDEYRISQRIPAAAAEALTEKYDPIEAHEAEEEPDDEDADADTDEDTDNDN